MVIATLTLLILAQSVVFHFVTWRRLRPMLRVARDCAFQLPVSKKYLGYDLLSLLIAFTLGPAMGVGWYIIIRELVEGSLVPPSDVFIDYPPDRLMFALPALFLAIFGLLIPGDLIFRILLRDRYQDYVTESYRRQRDRNLIWILPWMNCGFSILAVVFITLASDWHVFFRRATIEFDEFLDSGTRIYDYSEVTEVAMIQKSRAPSGKVQRNPHVAIRFADGFLWRSSNALRRVDPPRDAALLLLLKEKTGLEVQQHELLP